MIRAAPDTPPVVVPVIVTIVPSVGWSILTPPAAPLAIRVSVPDAVSGAFTLRTKPPALLLSVILKFVTPVTALRLSGAESVNVALPLVVTVRSPVVRFRGPMSPEPAIRLIEPEELAFTAPVPLIVPAPDTVRLIVLVAFKLLAPNERELADIDKAPPAPLALIGFVKVTAPVLVSVKLDPDEAPFPVSA